MSKSIQIQAANKLTLQGKLLDINFGEGKTKDGRPYARATVTIRVTQTYGGKTETSEIPVGMFAAQYTSKGDINPAWKSIQDLKYLKTIQNCGVNDADTVRITSATLQENNFISRNGQLINGWQIRGSFVNKANNVPDAASFATEIYIMNMEDEVNREGETTGRMIIKGGIVQYGGKLDVVRFIVENPDTIDYIQRHWEENKTLTVRGFVRVTSTEVTKPASEGGWGEEIPEATTQFIRELIVTKGDDDPKEDEFAYDSTEIKKAFNERKIYIEQLQIDARKKATAAPPSAPGTSKNYDWEG